jgi:hypothetical protein
MVLIFLCRPALACPATAGMRDPCLPGLPEQHNNDTRGRIPISLDANVFKASP